MLQSDKCEFLQHEVANLGHIIGEDGVRLDPQISVVKEFPISRNAKNVRQFLDLAGYYCRFIFHFSRIASSLSNLLKKVVTFIWSKKHLTHCENYCARKRFCNTQTSSFHLYSQLMHLIRFRHWQLVKSRRDRRSSYCIRMLNSAEKNYSTIEKDLLAITYCVIFVLIFMDARLLWSRIINS